MIRRTTRRLLRLGVITAIGYGVAKLIESFRDASDTGRPPRAEPWRPALPADPIKVEGDALLAPHGEASVRAPAEPVITASEKPPSTPPPPGNAGPETRAPASRPVQTPRSPAPPRTEPDEPLGGG